MPRLQIYIPGDVPGDVPGHFHFSTEIAVYVGHINSGAHLDNVQLLTLYSEARRRFFARLGYSEDNVEGLRTTVTDMMAIYRSEGFVGETLVFHISAGEFNKYGGDLIWIAREKSEGREVARGKNGFVFLEAGIRKPAPVPAGFVARLSGCVAEHQFDV